MNKFELKTINDGYPNLFNFEGNSEFLVDKLRELELGKLKIGDEKTYGIYENKFKCIDKNTFRRNGVKYILSLIEVYFADQDDPFFLKCVDFIFNGEREEYAIHWMDSDGRTHPAKNENFFQIMENMDIFFDEL